MIISNYLSKRTTEKFASCNVIDSEQKDEYIYCFEYLYDLLIYNISLVIIGCIFHDTFAALIYILCMSALKATAGGFHATHRITCSIMSYAIYITSLLTYKWLNTILFAPGDHLLLLMGIFQAIISLGIFTLCPVGSPNKTFCLKEKSRLKLMTAVLLAIIFIIFILLEIKAVYRYCYLICLCLLITYINQTIGIITNGKYSDSVRSEDV